MINWIKSLFTSQTKSVCPCHGYEKVEGQLATRRTARGFRVCPKEALESSLSQMGSGIVLSPELAEAYRQKVLKVKPEPSQTLQQNKH